MFSFYNNLLAFYVTFCMYVQSNGCSHCPTSIPIKRVIWNCVDVFIQRWLQSIGPKIMAPGYVLNGMEYRPFHLAPSPPVGRGGPIRSPEVMNFTILRFQSSARTKTDSHLVPC